MKPNTLLSLIAAPIMVAADSGWHFDFQNGRVDGSGSRSCQKMDFRRGSQWSFKVDNYKNKRNIERGEEQCDWDSYAGRCRDNGPGSIGPSNWPNSAGSPPPSGWGNSGNSAPPPSSSWGGNNGGNQAPPPSSGGSRSPPPWNSGGNSGGNSNAPPPGNWVPVGGNNGGNQQPPLIPTTWGGNNGGNSNPPPNPNWGGSNNGGKPNPPPNPSWGSSNNGGKSSPPPNPPPNPNWGGNNGAKPSPKPAPRPQQKHQKCCLKFYIDDKCKDEGYEACDNDQGKAGADGRSFKVTCKDR